MCIGFPERRKKALTRQHPRQSYVALGDAVKELTQVWRFVLLGKGIDTILSMLYNTRRTRRRAQFQNTSTLAIPFYHISTLAIPFYREVVHQGYVVHVPSEHQQTDIFTKMSAFGLFAIHRRFYLVNFTGIVMCF